jgi:hypothetical protein
MIGVLAYAPWVALGPVVVANGLPEAGLCAVLVLLVVGAWMRIQIGKRKGANL